MFHWKIRLSFAFYWIGSLNVRALNFHPSALKNLFCISTHCKRSPCRKHSIKSIPIITPNVMLVNKNMPTIMTKIFPVSIPPPIVFSRNTLDSWPCAKDKAHKRRYEAVFEILPNMN